MDIVQQLDERVWREFVDSHPQGQIFHRPEMFQVFARAKGHRPTLWAAVDHDGQVLALVLPVQIALLNRLLDALTTRAVAYGSVLCASGPQGQEALARLLHSYKHQVKRQPLFTELRNSSDLSAVQPTLQDNGFIYEPHLNFLVDIGLPVDRVWSNIHKSARKNIKKALGKNQFEVENVDNPSQVAICYAMLQQTYTTAHIPLADVSLFEAAFDILQPRGMIKFLLGRVEDTYVAASVALLYKDIIYGWYRGFNRAYSSYLPNDLMVWHILKWGAENGYRTFDFGGAGMPGEDYGPRKFKAKFGGQLLEFGRNTCIHAKLRLQISQFAYRLYRQLL